MYFPPRTLSGPVMKGDPGASNRPTIVKVVILTLAFSMSLWAWGFAAAVIMAVIWGLGWLIYRSYDLFYHSFKSGRAWLFVFRALTTLLTVAFSLFVPALVAEWLGFARPDATPLAWLGLLYAIPPLAMIESRRDNAFLAIAFASGGAVIVHVIFLVRDPAQGFSTIASFALILLLIWLFSTGLEKKEQDIDQTWRRLAKLAEAQSQLSPHGLQALLAVIDDIVGKGRNPRLHFNIPAERRWRTFSHDSDSLLWTETNSQLERVRSLRLPDWDSPLPMEDAGYGSATLTLAAPVALVSDTRLRAIIEVTFKPHALSRRLIELAQRLNSLPLGDRVADKLIELARAGQYELERRVEEFTPALNQILDRWRTEQARRTFEACSARIWETTSQEEISGVAAALSAYFGCGVTIWRSRPNGQLELSDMDWGGACQAPTTPGITKEALSALTLLPALHGAFPGQPRLVHEADLEPGDRDRLSVVGATDLVFCPLVNERGPNGLLMLLANRRPELTAREQDWLGHVATLLGFGFAHRANSVSLRRMADHTTDVIDLIQNLVSEGASAYAVRELHQAVADKARTILEADSIVLYGLDAKAQRIVHAVCSGDIRSANISRVFDRDSAIQVLVDQGDCIFAEDAVLQLYPKSRLQAPEISFVQKHGITSTFAAPLIVKGTTIGVLFANYRKRQTFGSRPQDLYRLFASLAAHTLALSGYHREWALETVSQDRRKVGRKFHHDVKGLAELTRNDLHDCLDNYLTATPNIPLARNAVNRAIEWIADIAERAGELLVTIDNDEDWLELDRTGLSKMLHKQAVTLVASRDDLAFHTDYDEQHRLSLDNEKCILDFGVEAILNAVKHAARPKITVTLSQEDDDVVLRICDDGPGQSQASIDDLKAKGRFRTLREAAHHFAWQIGPGPVSGLEAMLRVPLNNAVR